MTSPAKIDESELESSPTNQEEQNSVSASIDTSMEEKDTCKKCQRLVKKDGIECEACLTWFHFKCVSITEKEGIMFQKLNDKAKWFCDDCITEIKVIKEKK